MSSAPERQWSKVLIYTTIPVANEDCQQPYSMAALYLPLFPCTFVISSHFNSGPGLLPCFLAEEVLAEA